MHLLIKLIKFYFSASHNFLQLYLIFPYDDLEQSPVRACYRYISN